MMYWNQHHPHVHGDSYALEPTHMMYWNPIFSRHCAVLVASWTDTYDVLKSTLLALSIFLSALLEPTHMMYWNAILMGDTATAGAWTDTYDVLKSRLFRPRKRLLQPWTDTYDVLKSKFILFGVRTP